MQILPIVAHDLVTRRIGTSCAHVFQIDMFTSKHAPSIYKRNVGIELHNTKKGHQTVAIAFHDSKWKNRKVNNSKTSTLRMPMLDSWFMIMRVFEEASTTELPATLVIVALSIRTSWDP